MSCTDELQPNVFFVTPVDWFVARYISVTLVMPRPSSPCTPMTAAFVYTAVPSVYLISSLFHRYFFVAVVAGGLRYQLVGAVYLLSLTA